VGKVHKPLESVKTKYLAVSPVTDNSEHQDFETDRESPHPNFLIKIWWVNNGFCVTKYNEMMKNYLQKIGKNWLSANEHKLHQPNMHVDIRRHLCPPKCHLANTFKVLTKCFWL
jgi:hypothetical protein